MNRFEILDRMEKILNEKVRSIIPGMINCYLIQAPVRNEFGEFVDIHITARGLLYDDYLGGVARTYKVEELFPYDYTSGKFFVDPKVWERFERITERETEEMLLKLTKMIKEHVEEEKEWRDLQTAGRLKISKAIPKD